MPLTPGALVGPYKILNLLGTGGMGEVYRAMDERLGRDVAIKILPPAYATDPDRLRRFNQEARAAAALNHPNILAVHDIGSHNDSPYIVSEVLQGQTLRQLLGRGALSTRKALDYGIAVATGLAAAHDKGIVHRDIKPENVFVTGDGRVKILDFGLAKLRESPADADTRRARGQVGSTTSMVLGTAGYMSPEQVRGEWPDHRSDIFSLGAMLYEMVSGARAFKAGTPIETLSAILTHDPPPLIATHSIPPPLASVIQHCLEKERDQRFQSARDLAFALSRLAWPSATESAPPAAPRVPRRLWIHGTVVVAVIAAVGAILSLARSAASPDSPSFQQLTFRRGRVANARFAPDGQTVISSARWDGNPFELVSTRLDTAESTALPLPLPTILHSISRSGDLAVTVKSNILARVPIGGGGTRELLDRVQNADWAADGSLAVIRWEGRRAWLEHPPGKVLYEPNNALNVVRFSPDGRFLAVVEQFTMGGGGEWLTILDRDGSVVQQSKRFGSVVFDGAAWTPDGREVWFTVSDLSDRAVVRALTLDGRERVVHRAMSSVRILDIAPDGRVLLANDRIRADMGLVDISIPGERDLSWKEWSRPTALSDDGTLLAFGDGGRASPSGEAHGYIRRTDGSPAVLLGEEGAGAISPDGNWVLGGGPTSPPRLRLVPIGPGAARTLEVGRLAAYSGISNGKRWMADGQRLVFVANEVGRPRRVFMQRIGGGAPEAVTPEGAFGPIAASPDSAFVVVRNPNGQLAKYPVVGGTPASVSGTLPGDEPLAWSADGLCIWVLDRTSTPANIFRVDLITGRRTLWHEVPYADPAAIDPDTLRVVMSTDGTKFVYGYQKLLSELYVAQGLK